MAAELAALPTLVWAGDELEEVEGDVFCAASGTGALIHFARIAKLERL